MPTVSDIASLLKVPVARGDPQRQITGVAALIDAGPGDISFLSSDSHRRDFGATRAGAVIVQQGIKLQASPKAALLAVDDAELALVRVLEMFAPPPCRPPRGIDPNARIAPDAVVAPDAAVGPLVVIGHRSHIAARTVLHPGVIVADDVVIGDDCELFPNVVVRHRVTIGSRVAIHAGSVIGSDGFGYAWDGTKHVKVPQIGTVIIEDDVEIGSCVCVDRAKMGATRIGRGTKIDNLVQIAHNCVTGPHCILVGQSGLAGSATLGTGVVLGGQAAVRDHMSMGDGSIAAARSGVTKDVPPGMTVSGMPAIPHRQSLREHAALRHLPELLTHFRKLQERVDKLDKHGKPRRGGR
jgi:UDP-3-O-[3-hydroxymyristoyl] glucosamine N-acyltransferase